MPASSATDRLTQAKEMLTGGKKGLAIPWDPEWTTFPLRKDLPKIDGAPDDAAWFWGSDDYIGRLNLLTPTRVKVAASEIRTGEMVRLDLPLDEPRQPGFGRQIFEHTIVTITKGYCYDDVYTLNTQGGSQWDGFRHFAHLPSGKFYNNTSGEDILGPNATDHKCGIQHWSGHGFTGRAILLDYWSYVQFQGKTYNCYSTHSIPFSELVACGKSQGLDIRPESQGGNIKVGDILLIRSGFVDTYRNTTPEEAQRLALRGFAPTSKEEKQCYVGVEQSEEMLTWLHDCYFSAVGGDAPAFEAWPTQQEYHLHEYILSLWGMPLGEMIDLEKVSEVCRRLGRWTFFFTSAPENCKGGVGAHPNATAIF